jgi:hypothetical protein
MNKDSYIALIVTQLAFDGASAATIQFFRKVAPSLLSNRYIGGQQAAELAYMCRQSSARHLDQLTLVGCLTRRNYRRWELSDQPIRDRSIIPLVRYAYSP